ncbi:DUF6194 family protein [Amycolatopsis regifaucium]|uniref:DUF6194 domain-containing protein n=1 Tax=Amycolatopsis regifaucium TaxID=546365 RepID=A0A154MEQ1_9PSEU|nr:DUF6194 family protein [Amycolatopsis regifaucium]KZB82962.1 hypothetical protein AVL48_37015 [Amycolatopsis regifaucium]OKA11339.1 hypothetical protein ATP06_0200265 [Amycolatopsis regifaucium]SFH44249.1 hypothetical protein SAMN04489731_104208 [Amycolatopsis regifaucium]
MTIDEIISFVSGLDGVLALTPAPGDDWPELSWGDAFFYYSPDGVVPTNVQPFATVVTKNYPGDEASRLDRPDTFRVNIHAGKEEFTRRLGRSPREAGETEADVVDTVLAHPVYGTAGWLAVVNPGPKTEVATRELLQTAYRLARTRFERKAESSRE